MENTIMVEKILQRYNYYKHRANFLSKEKKMIEDEALKQDKKIYINLIDYSSTVNQTKTLQYENSTTDQCTMNDILAKKIKEIDSELSYINYLVELVDESLIIIKKINERYKFILEKYYIQKVRMEDIAGMIHTSRSRCYELCKEGVVQLLKYVFGESKITNFTNQIQ